jgi:hypothetical protein
MDTVDSLQIARAAELGKNHSMATGKPPKTGSHTLFALEDSMVKQGMLRSGLFEEARRWDQSRPVIEYIENRSMLGELVKQAQELFR